MHLCYRKLRYVPGVFHRNATARTEITVMIKYGGKLACGRVMTVPYSFDDLFYRPFGYDRYRNLPRSTCS